MTPTTKVRSLGIATAAFGATILILTAARFGSNDPERIPTRALPPI
jgi:hypothetical protein